MLFYSAILFFCIGCTNYAVRTKDNPHCKTIVSGKAYSQVNWSGQYPAIILKEDGDSKTYYGSIVEIKQDGVIFARKLSGRYNRPEKFFPFSDVLCLIDKNKELVYGKIPKEKEESWRVDFTIIPLKDPKAESLTMNFEPNEDFSFCLEPGDYKVREMKFTWKNDYTDFANELPDLTFSVKPDTENYIGEIHIDSTISGNESIKIPCISKDRPSDMSVGIMFGVVGTIVNEVIKEGEEVEHTISITNNSKPGTATESLLKKGKK